MRLAANARKQADQAYSEEYRMALQKIARGYDELVEEAQRTLPEKN
jgi:hypothetical protein